MRLTQIQSLFLTHLHRDHYSGLPQLLNYLVRAGGTLEYFVSPQIPDEIGIWRRSLELAHDQTISQQLTAVLKAMKGLQALSSVTHSDHKVMPIRLVDEGFKGEDGWRGQLHPALFFAPVNPTDQTALQLLRSAFEEASLQNTTLNAISHAFLVRYDAGPQRHIGLFTGDLAGPTWRYVKNRCLEITANSIRSELSLVKVPHHGAQDHVMEICVKELINKACSFVASISCPAGDPKHPAQRTLAFLKNSFKDCCIACTNISTTCHEQGYPSVAHELFDQPAKEAEFMEFASSRQPADSLFRSAGACAGNYTITLVEKDYTLERSTGLPCSFNPAGCR